MNMITTLASARGRALRLGIEDGDAVARGGARRGQAGAVGEQHTRVQVGDEIAEPGGGLAGIERRVELARLQHAQERHDERDAELERERHGLGVRAEAVEEPFDRPHATISR